MNDLVFCLSSIIELFNFEPCGKVICERFKKIELRFFHGQDYNSSIEISKIKELNGTASRSIPGGWR